ncbi:MAG: hypothetical protein ACFFDS_08630 [Candidatus Thorarchaeota archaeon]
MNTNSQVELVVRMKNGNRESLWKAFQDLSRREQEAASKLYSIIRELMEEYGEEIPLDVALRRLGFKNVDEMIDWELQWLPRKELNIKMEYNKDKIKIQKNVFDEDDLSVYDFF